MPHKHFWAGVGVALGPFKGGSATNKTKNVPHKPLCRGCPVALLCENTQREEKTAAIRAKNAQNGAGIT